MFYREYTLAGNFTAKAGDVVFEARKLEDDGGKAEIVVKGKVLYNSIDFVRVKAAYTNAKAEGKPLPACEPEEAIYNDPLFQEFLKHQPPSW
tara:strand:- start:777 stop:1052 length:276 start_codon:yes stop_codon:yes gene_type:complete